MYNYMNHSIVLRVGITQLYNVYVLLNRIVGLYS